MTSQKTPFESANRRTRILIVDDHPMMRYGMAQLINQETDLTVCSEAETARDAVAAIRGSAPDLVLADLTIPGKDGLELIKDMQALQPGLPVLVVSMHDESVYAERVLRAGARGYLMKQEGGAKLLKAIRRVLKGQIYVSEAVSERILENLAGRRPQSGYSLVEKLTDRELEVFRLIGQAKEAREIARELHMSVKTVEAHRLSIKRKLKLKTAPELTRAAVLWTESNR